MKISHSHLWFCTKFGFKFLVRRKSVGILRKIIWHQLSASETGHDLCDWPRRGSNGKLGTRTVIICSVQFILNSTRNYVAMSQFATEVVHFWFAQRTWQQLSHMKWRIVRLVFSTAQKSRTFTPNTRWHSASPMKLHTCGLATWSQWHGGTNCGSTKALQSSWSFSASTRCFPSGTFSTSLRMNAS